MAQRSCQLSVEAVLRANGSIRFESDDAVDDGLSFGIQILQERSFQLHCSPSVLLCRLVSKAPMYLRSCAMPLHREQMPLR